MARQPTIARRAEALLGTAVAATAPVAGGDVCTATKLRLSNGTTALMKTLPSPPSGFFEREAAGLRWLADAADGVAVPEVLAVAADCLVLAWVEPGRGPTADDVARFGRELAATHVLPAGADGAPPAFGADVDGFIARLPLPNRTAPTWAEFYATRRVLPYLKLARDRDAIDAGQAADVERVVGRLRELVPEEPPARLHGDLWNGNVLFDERGSAALVDPAAYAGHREVDLAMLSLFGLPHLPRALEAYQEVDPLADGWADRISLHQLFPLLAHACLFGGGYGARAAACAAEYR